MSNKLLDNHNGCVYTKRVINSSGNNDNDGINNNHNKSQLLWKKQGEKETINTD